MTTIAKLRETIKSLILEMSVSQSEMEKIIDMMLDSAESCKQAIELAESLGLIEGKDGKDVYIDDRANNSHFVFVCDPEFADQFERQAIETCPSHFDPSISEYYAKNPETGRFEPTGKMSLNFYIPSLKAWPAGWRGR